MIVVQGHAKEKRQGEVDLLAVFPHRNREKQVHIVNRTQLMCARRFPNVRFFAASGKPVDQGEVGEILKSLVGYYV
jgi:hypothetical protein